MLIRWIECDTDINLDELEDISFSFRNDMNITVSGVKKEYKDGLTLNELIELENVEMPQYVTVSINDEFVSSEERDNTVIKDGDSVEFLYFMGGGC